MSDFEQITTSRDGRVVVLTLDRPERLNAWTPVMSAELTAAIEAADVDPDVGAVVVTGAGRGFCAGADIEATFNAQLEGDDGAAAPAGRRDWVDLVRSTKPILAAVNGVAIGVGLTMVLPFDRIVASTEARFSLRFVKMGLVPELGSSHFVPARIGFGATSDLMLSGRMIDADEALRVGLVDQVVPHDEVLAATIERAAEYAENPARQLRWIKELITRNAAEADPSVVQRREMARLEECYRSPEHEAAVKAFLSRSRG